MSRMQIEYYKIMQCYFSTFIRIRHLRLMFTQERDVISNRSTLSLLIFLLYTIKHLLSTPYLFTIYNNVL